MIARLSTILLLCILCGCGDDSQQVYQQAYAARMAQFQAQPAPAGSTIMVGDSITQGWIQGFPPGWYNRGIGMDTVAGVVSRLPTHIEIDRPARIVLLIGINSAGQPEQDWPALQAIIERHPEIQWYVISLLPTTWPCGAFVPAFNAWLSRNAAGAFAYIDAYSIFAADGRWDVLLKDGLHPTQAGYELLGKALSGI